MEHPIPLIQVIQLQNQLKLHQLYAKNEIHLDYMLTINFTWLNIIGNSIPTTVFFTKLNPGSVLLAEKYQKSLGSLNAVWGLSKYNSQLLFFFNLPSIVQFSFGNNKVQKELTMGKHILMNI